MKIAVLSGKGGTGKTLVSVNLAAVAALREMPTQGVQADREVRVCYVDCDVEEPNGHLFFKPEGIESEAVTVKVPVVDAKVCNGCRTCVSFCRFNALAYIGTNVRVFESICHSCGGCALLCPVRAISERDKPIGRVEAGRSGDVEVLTGIMNTGEETGVPIVKQLLRRVAGVAGVAGGDDGNGSEGVTVIDCPPGSSCMVMESIKDADYLVLVAEPTTFGAHNLEMVAELARIFGKPTGCVLNKCLGEENPSEQFCEAHGVPIIGRIPYDGKLGALNSSGEVAARVDEAYTGLFAAILDRIQSEVAG